MTDVVSFKQFKNKFLTKKITKLSMFCSLKCPAWLKPQIEISINF